MRPDKASRDSSSPHHSVKSNLHFHRLVESERRKIERCEREYLERSAYLKAKWKASTLVASLWVMQ